MKKTLLVLYTLVIFLSFPAFLANADDYSLYKKSGDRSAKWDSLVKAGFETFDSNNLETSYAFMQKAYDLGCRDGLLLFKLGLFYENSKDYKKTLEYYEKASSNLLNTYPNHIESKRIYEHLGRVYYQTEQNDKAREALEKAVKNDPKNFMIHFMLAQISRMEKNYTEAISHFEEALTLETPEEMKPIKIILTELMKLYFEMKDYENCLRYADNILAQWPGDSTALSYRGQIEKMQYEQKERETIRKMVE